jgi:hypothetical protein
MLGLIFFWVKICLLHKKIATVGVKKVFYQKKSTVKIFDFGRKRFLCPGRKVFFYPTVAIFFH